MIDVDLLFVIAEIGAAFGGFASIVALLGSAAARDAKELNAFRLQGVLVSGLVVVLGALLPALIEVLGWQSPVIWRTACAVLGVIGAGYIVSVRRSRQRLLDGPCSDPTLIGVVSYVLLVPVGLLAIGAAGMLPNPSATYVWALYLYLLSSALGLYRLVQSLLEGAIEPPSA